MKTLKAWIKVLNKSYKVEELPKLSTGKANFKGAKQLAEELSDGS